MTERGDHGSSYLEQEGGDRWSESDPPFYRMLSDNWPPLVDNFPYDHFLESPSAPLAPDLATSASPGALHEITNVPYDKGSPPEDGASGADTSSPDLHKMSDITSTIISTVNKEKGPATVIDDSLQRPTSYGKVSAGIRYVSFRITICSRGISFSYVV